MFYGMRGDVTMTRVDQVVRQIRAELANGRHGKPSDRFMAVRQVSAR